MSDTCALTRPAWILVIRSGGVKLVQFSQMQFRFDGTLGFPGGIVDSGETPESSVTREFVEEVGVADGDLVFTEKDHVVTHFSDTTHFCLHFFAREVELDKFVAMERKALLSKDWGQEVSTPRLPLFKLLTSHLDQSGNGNCSLSAVHATQRSGSSRFPQA